MKQVVRKLLLLLTLTLAATLGLHAEEKETFFVRIVPPACLPQHGKRAHFLPT